ncbi:14-3-3-like protein [Psilocybe cubensis]|uniref:14-3-3-like protein n=1 Tax=Psilocybe cubensis TaxID=181762 RepID=A0ACB8H907_PSICU|nr:14-3-3-like protein [Psilocybe cubensis]KAH9484403.1 14-3-3-like protein [Psilocybe cubensis]
MVLNDAMEYIEHGVKYSTGTLTIPQQNLLAVVYKKGTLPIISLSQTLGNLTHSATQSSYPDQRLVKMYLRSVIHKAVERSIHLLILIDNNIWPFLETTEEILFFLKLKADINRHLFELGRNQEGHNRQLERRINAYLLYQQANQNAQEALHPFHSLRLSITLRFCIFLHKFYDSTPHAKEKALAAFDHALILDSLKVWGLGEIPLRHRHSTYQALCIKYGITKIDIETATLAEGNH